MRFGPAGYPKAGKTPEGSLDYTRELGLDALEVGFVRGARISPERARAIGEHAARLDIRMSCHAPYYINFNSDNPETRVNSLRWVTDTARAAHHMGAYLIVIHAASYGKSPETASEAVVEGLLKCRDLMDDEGTGDVILGIETMGKKAQFGTLEEISAVLDAVDGTQAVLDVAHVHARDVGRIRTPDEMARVLDEFLPLSGDIAHFHISCIKYGERGEISHLPLSSKEPDLQFLADLLDGSPRDCTFICESPLVEEDAVVFRDMFPSYRR